MDPRELEHFAASMNRMADASGDLIREMRYADFETEIKNDGSPVTSVDQAVETRIREIIAELHPDHGIIGEEHDDVAPDSEFVWVIDPIDGTLPFLAGFPVFGTLISLVHHQNPILGTIDMPMTRERWVGGGDLQTLRNGEPVHVRACDDISTALMSTSNPDFYDKGSAPALARMKQATKLSVYGGSCMAYAQIASGRIDIGMDVQFDIFDFLALVPVIAGAGGVITDWDGMALNVKSGDRFIATGDKCIHDQALKILNQ
jgi:histidinol phosphatase-like enzyme (inositol monophosphatase family)